MLLYESIPKEKLWREQETTYEIVICVRGRSCRIRLGQRDIIIASIDYENRRYIVRTEKQEIQEEKGAR